VSEVIAAIEKIVGRKVNKKFGPRRPGDPPSLVADPSKAQAALKWKASRTLNEIVSSAWAWLRRHYGQK
jgi:UDP-glucose 4-epimerase